MGPVAPTLERFGGTVDDRRALAGRQGGEPGEGADRDLAGCRGQSHGATLGELGEADADPLDGLGVRLLEVAHEVHDVGLVLGLGKHTGEDDTIAELVLEGEVSEQSLGEGLDLLGSDLGQRSDTADRVADPVGRSADAAEGLLDAGRAGVRFLGVVLELATDLLAPCLGDAHPGDLRLGAGEAEKHDKLVQKGGGIVAGFRHGANIGTRFGR